MPRRLEAVRATVGAAVARAVFRLPTPWLARLAGPLPESDGHPLDPQIGFMLRAMSRLRLSDIDHLPPARARVHSGRSLKLLAGRRRPLARVVDRTVDGPGGPLRLRIYTPRQHRAPGPGILYCHGGGFVIGDLETHDAPCSILADESGCVVVAVDYRLAPEHPFPAAVDDAAAAFLWTVEHAAELGLDPRRLAVGGDSAGGNLSTVVAQTAVRERWPVAPAFQLLIYPGTDMRRGHPSHAAFADGFLLTRRMLDYFVGHYLPDAAHLEDPRASPLLAEDLAGVAPAYVAVAGFDPLRDEGRAYAERLRAAGVPTRLVCHRDLVHGWLSLGAGVTAAAAALVAAAAALREGLA